MSDRPIRVLFVCSRNEWRSPTAEAIYKRFPAVEARSAGTSPKARIQVNAKQIEWADIIFAMEKRHQQMLQQRFSRSLIDAKVVCLDIPDDYQFMDEGLIAIIKERVRAYIPVPE